MANNLFQTYRPIDLDHIFGHDKIVKEFRKRFKENSIPHAMFFFGMTGTGKTTFIRIIAKSILCKEKDENGNACNKCDICTTIDKEKLSNIYFEYNASNLNIEAMRDIEESAQKGVLGKYNIKIFVIDEMQELSKNRAAEKNILKILEKPSENVYFILGAMDASKVSKAIKNRCVPYKLNKLSIEDVSKYLEFICKRERIKIDTAEKATTIVTLAQNCNGSMRDAVSYLERVIYSDLWNTNDLLKELEIISDTDAIIIINHILEGNTAAFEYELNEEVLKKVKYLLLLCNKKICGINLNEWQKGQIRDINIDKYKIEFFLEELDKLSFYPYIYPDLIEYHFIKVLSHMKTANSIDNYGKEEKRRRLK